MLRQAIHHNLSLVVEGVPLISSFLASSSRRTYISRAHPRVMPQVGLYSALRDVLEDFRKRQRRRLRKGERNDNPLIKSVDETMELALNLNLDPRKPNQALRGSISLPHGSGKAVNCLVFTSDPSTIESLKEGLLETSGASRVEIGGEELVDKIVAGEVAADTFHRGLATPEMQSLLTKKLARVLGPRGLMPNKKTGTLVDTPEELIDSLKTQMTGKQVVYRTEKEGIVHLRIGRASFGVDKLVENIGTVMKEIFSVKPDAYGKGKKKASKNAKYLLRASITSTQGKGIRVDTRTLDPSSPFFLSYIEREEENKREEGKEEEAVAS